MPPAFAFLKTLKTHDKHGSAVQSPKNRVEVNNDRPRKLRKSSISTVSLLFNAIQKGERGERSPKATNTIKFPSIISPKPDDLRQKNETISRPPFPPPYQASNMEEGYIRQTLIRSETPVVSRYMSDGFRYPQVQEAIQSPSRSWSPIPSVHRESFPDEELYEDDLVDHIGSSGNWVNKQKVLPSKIGTDVEGHGLETLSNLPESSKHQHRYIEYPSSWMSRQDHWVRPWPDWSPSLRVR
ncbi:hypothetical protein CPB84DRAFT_1757646 [Gymnopilus junonius]|uniref:Uncharacterized protein n=1 Tax=Gymnopilus junonius TaxID=109634 RepID=A0A9P5P485_GYMJU|nr:hypothetical protein CPB84DRAFT_1757646 [Gymnopilus junonius]